MRQLRFVGVAEDGGSLLLESPTGESYRLPVDERVRAACRGDLTRLGQIEMEIDNPLRPAEIQARVRSGESAEQVAASSGMPMDRVLRFAYPVLQERSRVVAQARLLPARPKAPEPLGELVEQRLVSRGTDAATLAWDAWRREDGRWAVRLGWRHGDRAHAAHWSLDLGRRALQPEDPAAEQLGAEEFHARTMTAVTPLAVAARAAGAGPSPARDDPAPPPKTGRSQGADPRTASSRSGRAEATRPTSERSRAAEPRPREPEATGPTGARGSGGGAGSGGGSGSGRDASSGGGRSGGTRRSNDAAGPTGARGAAGPASAGDADEEGESAEAGRIAAGGGALPLVDVPDGEDDRAHRATVPSWDDILLGVRRRH